MDARIDLQRALAELLTTPAGPGRREAARALGAAAEAFVSAPDLPAPDVQAALRRDGDALATIGDRLERMDDAALATFNRLLPWGAFTIDRRGRSVGGAWSARKRPAPNALIDRRLAAFDAEFPLRGRTALEVGCFEGIHTLGLLLLGARPTGVDGRVENILKTLARLWAYGFDAPLVHWNVETRPPPDLPERWDVLHHIGVLYHLADPVGHLHDVLPRTSDAVILDTHVARDDAGAAEAYESGGCTYAYQRQDEGQRDVSPFAGLMDHAKWLRSEDLLDICRRHGFGRVRLVQDRDEPNGRRVLIWAFR